MREDRGGNPKDRERAREHKHFAQRTLAYPKEDESRHRRDGYGDRDSCKMDLVVVYVRCASREFNLSV